ncbi:MAG: AAA family ATPase [Dehalococcoidia bacterium]
MQFNVIAISRTLGAGGESLGEALADALGFRYVDSEIIDRAAALAKATPAEVAQVEARKGLMARILDNLARTGGAGATGMVEPVVLDLNTPGYEQLIVDVIRETAEMGMAVIVAHGASIPLAGTPGVLRVMVTASANTRAARTAQAEGVAADRARKLVADSDAARADYFRRFYHLERELPTNYDLVVNTDAMTVEQAQAAVLAVVQA